MKESPILFNGDMVRAILDGRKTQTRRIVQDPRGLYAHLGNKSVHPAVTSIVHVANGIFVQQASDALKQQYVSTFPFHPLKFPSGQVGDRLYVRETFYCDHTFYPDGTPDACQGTPLTMEEKRAELLAEMYYRADGEPPFEDPTPVRWTPSIHMPKWAARIWLEITDVRVERLQAISQADAIAEGGPPSHSSIDRVSHQFGFPDFPRSWFGQLWQSVYGVDSWNSNPWVWAITFKRVKP